jgi:hypothetical protein
MVRWRTGCSTSTLLRLCTVTHQVAILAKFADVVAQKFADAGVPLSPPAAAADAPAAADAARAHAASLSGGVRSRGGGSGGHAAAFGRSSLDCPSPGGWSAPLARISADGPPSSRTAPAAAARPSLDFTGFGVRSGQGTGPSVGGRGGGSLEARVPCPVVGLTVGAQISSGSFGR